MNTGTLKFQFKNLYTDNPNHNHKLWRFGQDFVNPKLGVDHGSTISHGARGRGVRNLSAAATPTRPDQTRHPLSLFFFFFLPTSPLSRHTPPRRRRPRVLGLGFLPRLANPLSPKASAPIRRPRVQFRALPSRIVRLHRWNSHASEIRILGETRGEPGGHGGELEARPRRWRELPRGSAALRGGNPEGAGGAAPAGAVPPPGVVPRRRPQAVARHGASAGARRHRGGGAVVRAGADQATPFHSVRGTQADPWGRRGVVGQSQVHAAY